MTLTREQLIDTVNRSPACVLAQDKAGWLALFAEGGVVEDPVGSAPNRKGAGVRRGSDELGRFYETFIAGNEIRFEVAEDLVAGAEVVRDVVIHTRLSTGLRIEVPAHLIYEVSDEAGVPRIRRLRAVWDLRRRSASALASGLLGLWTLCAVSLHMFRVQGLGGVLAYSRGLIVGIFGQGARAAQALADAVARDDLAAIDALFAPGARVELPAGTALSPRAMVDALGPGASLRVSRVTPAGWLTSFRVEIAGGAMAGQGGVAFLEFDPASRRIARARFFLR